MGVHGDNDRHVGYRVRRGQALIMVVLLMFALVGLGGVFIAMINQAMVHTARAEDRAALDEIAEAGLRYAEHQLVNTPDGADWRPEDGPDPSNPGWFAYGGGFYKIDVIYGRTDDAPIMTDSTLERHLRLDVEASYSLPNATDVPEDDPEYPAYVAGSTSGKQYLARYVTAYLQLGLSDYLVWITNIDGTPTPAALGSILSLVDPKDAMAGITDPKGIPVPNVDPRTVEDDDLESTRKSLTDGTQPLPSYLAVFNGPIRSETDLQLGSLRVDLTQKQNIDGVYRRDTLEVAGQLRPLQEPDTAKSWAMVNARNLLMDTADPRGLNLRLPDTVKDADLDTVQTQANNPFVQRKNAPRLDTRDPATGYDRYRALTLGTVTPGSRRFPPAASSADVYLWEGEGGLYVHNPGHIQHEHDLTALRQEWLSPDAAINNTSYCWAADTYRVYDPLRSADTTPTSMAVEITMNDWERNEVTGAIEGEPTLDFRWYQGDADDPVIIEDIPYPKNGVIFAEGNVVVKGNLPASLAFDESFAPVGTPQYPGGRVSADEVRAYVSDTNRRFDLTIVSGGTIYIDSHLPGPATRQEKYLHGTDDWRRITRGSAYDSKLALLAMDHVALNLTNIYDFNGSTPSTVVDQPAWSMSGANDTLKVTVNGIADPDPIKNRLRLLLRHSGDFIKDDNDFTHEHQYVIAKATVNGTPLSWEKRGVASEDIYFYHYPSWNAINFPFPQQPETLAGSLYEISSISDPILKLFGVGSLPNGSPPPTYVPSYIQAWPFAPITMFNPVAADSGLRSVNTLALSWKDCAPHPIQGTINNKYLVYAGDATTGPGVLVAGLDLHVDAMIYAQRGSWFVIPGKYYFDPLTPPAADNTLLASVYRWPFPQYREPQDVRVIVTGAIAQNRPAPVAEVEAWESRWRGSNLYYYDHNDDKIPDELDPAAVGSGLTRRMGIEYHYDATLMRPVRYTGPVGNRRYLPRLPKLPVSANLFEYGKRGAQ